MHARIGPVVGLVMGALAVLVVCTATPVAEAHVAGETAASRAVDGDGIAALPTGMLGFGGHLICPSASFCIGTAAIDNDAQDSAITTSTGAREKWTVVELPHPIGQQVVTSDLRCLSVSFCYAWGRAGPDTLWWSPSPATGQWKKHAFPSNVIVRSVSCPSTTTCVAATGFKGGVSGGAAWVSDDLATDAWSSTTLDKVKDLSDIDCATTSLCVISGRVPDQVENRTSIWSSANVRIGEWTRVTPVIDGSPVPQSVADVECPSATTCIVNGDAAQFFAGGSTRYWGYYASSAPATGGWEWHQFDPSGDPEAMHCRAVTSCLAWTDHMGFDADPVDHVVATPVELPSNFAINMRDYSCISADRCFAWGADAGRATKGPLAATHVWMGGSSGTWSNEALPNPAGYADKDQHIAMASGVDCTDSNCTAVGYLDGNDPPYTPVAGNLVWTKEGTGPWKIVAADRQLVGATLVRVKTGVSVSVRHLRGHARIVGRVTGGHGCAPDRLVLLVGHNGKTAARVTTGSTGHYSTRLTKALRSKMGSEFRAGAPRKRIGASVVCLAGQSSHVRLG